MDPSQLISILTGFADLESVGTSLAANAIYDAVRRVGEAVWGAHPQENLFDTLWRRAVEQAGADWSPLLVKRVAKIRDAFADGNVSGVDDFRGLLKDAGVNSDIAEDLLNRLTEHLREAHECGVGGVPRVGGAGPGGVRAEAGDGAAESGAVG